MRVFSSHQTEYENKPIFGNQAICYCQCSASLPNEQVQTGQRNQIFDLFFVKHPHLFTKRAFKGKK